MRSIKIYTSLQAAFLVNSFVVETENGVVVTENIEIEYIENFNELIRETENEGQVLSNKKKAAIKDAMRKKHLEYAVEFLIVLNTDGLKKEQI